MRLCSLRDMYLYIYITDLKRFFNTKVYNTKTPMFKNHKKTIAIGSDFVTLRNNN